MTITADVLADFAGTTVDDRVAVQEARLRAPEFRPMLTALAAAVDQLVVQLAPGGLMTQEHVERLAEMLATEPPKLPPGFRP